MDKHNVAGLNMFELHIINVGEALFIDGRALNVNPASSGLGCIMACLKISLHYPLLAPSIHERLRHILCLGLTTLRARMGVLRRLCRLLELAVEFSSKSSLEEKGDYENSSDDPAQLNDGLASTGVKSGFLSEHDIPEFAFTEKFSMSHYTRNRRPPVVSGGKYVLLT